VEIPNFSYSLLLHFCTNHALPPPTPSHVQNVFRRAVSGYIVGGTSAAAKLWPAVDNLVRGLPVVGGARWERAQRAAGQWWWLRKEQFRGRALAPYNTEM